MRQWPFFYDVARAATDWYEEGKAEIALPPVGPAGAPTSSYAAGWGFGIPRTSANVEAAQELVRFLTDKANTGQMAQIDTWYLSPRASVLEVAADDGIAPYLKMYPTRASSAPGRSTRSSWRRWRRWKTRPLPT